VSRHGFTLVEVLVAVAILAILVAGISGLLVQQGLLSAKQQLQRGLEENGRLALLDVSRAVRQAGYGIAPTAAFDFDRYACATPGIASTCPNGGRDRTDGPDEMVLSFRDPTFYRYATSIAGGGPWTVTLDRPLTQTINAGRIIQLLCGGAEPAAYLALSADAAAGSRALALRALTNADGYYPQAGPTDACFASAGVMLVERLRLFVQNDAFGVPCLYRERGRGGPELLERGVEDLQLTYQIGPPPAGSPYAAGGATPVGPPETCAGVPGWVFGACAGVRENPSEAATAPDWRGDPYDFPSRYGAHPANVRAVTITVVARSTQETPDRSGDALPALANRAARPAGIFKRSVFTVTEQTPNLLTRAHFLPPVFASANVGGG
jgi:prepilin-type N-terminal cleavage/methylation domain-containing protein